MPIFTESGKQKLFGGGIMYKKLFGKLPSGEPVFIYQIRNGRMVAQITEYGAAIVSLKPFGGVDVVGGFDSLEGYLADNSHQGAIVGRVANRIAKAQFSIQGRVYCLPDNDNGNCLHGGVGFQRRLWHVTDCAESSITLSYFSAAGEEGFPSGLTVFVTYTLQDSALLISYRATPDGTTPIALTNHAFFNLDGFGKDIKGHCIQIWADRYSEADEHLIPNGNHPFVDGTVLDLREPRKIGDAFTEQFEGYDHNLLLCAASFKDFNGKRVGLAARVSNQRLMMQMYTDQPCVQFYTGNFLGKGPAFKSGIPQVRHGAFCLEAQTEPNCINRGEAIYQKGENYHQFTAYEFIETAMI